MFQNEWDALVLETFHTKQQLHQSRIELSNALYENDAAKRVIARLIKERDDARNQLAQFSTQSNTTQQKTVDEDTDMQVDSKLPQTVIDEVHAKSEALTQTRRKRKAPETLTSPDTLAQFNVVHSSSSSKSGIHCLAIKDSLLVSGNKKGHVSVYDKENNGKVLFDTKAHSGAVNAVEWNGQSFVSVGEDGHLKVWNQDNDQWTEAMSISPHQGSSIVDLSVHPTGNYVISASSDSTWALVDIASQTVLSVVEHESVTTGYTSCHIHPDGILLALGAKDSKVRIFDIRTLSHVHTFEGHDGAVVNVKFSENGYYLASTSQDENLIRIWDLRKLANVHNINVDAPVSALSWDGFGQYLGCTTGNEVRVFLNKQWTNVLAVQVEKNMSGLVFGKDAGYIVTGASNGKITVLEQEQ